MIKRRQLNIILLLLLINATGGIYHLLWGEIFAPLTYFVLLICFYTLRNNEKFITKKLLLIIIIILLFLAFNYLIVPFDSSAWFYLKTASRFVLVLFVYRYYELSKSNIISDLTNALKIIAIHSLIGFVVSMVIHSYPISLIGRVTVDTLNYIFFRSAYISFIDYQIFRSQGIFWEPGVLQGFMNILLFLSSFIKRDLKLQLLSITCITVTFSSTGFILLFTQILFIIKTYLKFSYFLNIKKIVLLTVCFLLFSPVIYLGVDNVYNKFTNKGIHSSQGRMYDLYQGIKIILSYPLTGIGMDRDVYSHVQSIEETLDANEVKILVDWMDFDRQANSNSAVMIFVYFGVIFGLLYYYFLIKEDVIFVKKYLFIFLIIAINVTEPLIMSPFYLYFFISGLYTAFRVNKNTVLRFNQNTLYSGV